MHTMGKWKNQREWGKGGEGGSQEGRSTHKLGDLAL